MRFSLLAATALSTTISFLVPGVGFAQTAYDWSGGYVGVTTGVIYSEAPVSIDDVDTPVYARGALLGLTAGYNMDMAGIVVGVEGDAAVANVHGERSGLSGDFTTDLDSLLTLRGRLGFTSGNALFYGTAGIAGGQARYTASPGIYVAPDVADESGFVAGGIVGVGVEYALNDNMTIKTEGLVYQLSPLSAVNDNGKGGSYGSEYAASGVTLRTGVNFQF